MHLWVVTTGVSRVHGGLPALTSGNGKGHPPPDWHLGFDTGDPELLVSSTRPGSTGHLHQGRDPRQDSSGARQRRGETAAVGEPAASGERLELHAVGKYDRGNHLAGEGRRLIDKLQFSQNKLWLTLSLILCL